MGNPILLPHHYSWDFFVRMCHNLSFFPSSSQVSFSHPFALLSPIPLFSEPQVFFFRNSHLCQSHSISTVTFLLHYPSFSFSFSSSSLGLYYSMKNTYIYSYSYLHHYLPLVLNSFTLFLKLSKLQAHNLQSYSHSHHLSPLSPSSPP